MDSDKLSRQAKEVLGMLLIGRGIIELVQPVEHLRLWKGLSRATDRLVDVFLARPQLVRSIGCARIAIGLLLVSRQWTGVQRQTRRAVVETANSEQEEPAGIAGR